MSNAATRTWRQAFDLDALETPEAESDTSLNSIDRQDDQPVDTPANVPDLESPEAIETEREEADRREDVDTGRPARSVGEGAKLVAKAVLPHVVATAGGAVVGAAASLAVAPVGVNAGTILGACAGLVGSLVSRFIRGNEV